MTLPDITQVNIDNGFWSRVTLKVGEKVIPYQWEILNDRVPDAAPSHCIANIKIAAGVSRGEFQGFVFQDSDFAKWIEAAAYTLMKKRDPELEKNVDDAVKLIGKAQLPDGYFNTYYIIKEPGKRWTNIRDCHELYCAGHMMEAAVAYYEATGKRQLLDIMIRMAQHIDSVIGPEEGKLNAYPGHEEIELALIRMYEVTSDPLMLKLASYFIDERGTLPNFFEAERVRREGQEHFALTTYGSKYAQNHAPVREQTALEGHSVRALYLATGMADVARVMGDKSLFDACENLFNNYTQKRMYITGGAGQTERGEAFSFDYDLPNDTVYAETCASIALCFFMRAMLMLKPDARYADVMERALYNTCLAGMSLDGERFFYVNPLGVNPVASKLDPGKKHVLPERPRWFGCACCPPNLARLIASLGKYAYSADENALYVHLYVGGDVKIGDMSVSVSSDYPLNGRIKITPGAGEYTVCLRIPEYSLYNYAITINGRAISTELKDGYAAINRAWSGSDVVELNLDMRVRRIRANPLAWENIGKVALVRGPMVYCMEEADNGAHLAGVYLDTDAAIEEAYLPGKLEGIIELSTCGYRAIGSENAPLYTEELPQYERAQLTFIPYYAWANRGQNEMTVWVKEFVTHA